MCHDRTAFLSRLWIHPLSPMTSVVPTTEVTTEVAGGVTDQVTDQVTVQVTDQVIHAAAKAFTAAIERARVRHLAIQP